MALWLSDAAGNLDGTTVGNFCQQQSCGTVFELFASGNGNWTQTVLHYFNENDGGSTKHTLDGRGGYTVRHYDMLGGASGTGLPIPNNSGNAERCSV